LRLFEYSKSIDFFKTAININANDYEYYKLLNLDDVNFKLYSNEVNNNTKFKLLKTDNYEIVI
jgi:hypothetical protein